MWCIQKIDDEYRKRMYDLLNLYARSGRQLHVIAIDEKPKEIHSDSRKPVPGKPGSPERYDYEYVRNGKANIFVAVDPKKGKRKTKVTLRRTKRDFAYFLKDILDAYPRARKLHLVMDNLNTHSPKSLIETFGEKESEKMISRIEFHYTPTSASWLNMVEIFFSILSRETLKGSSFRDTDALSEAITAFVNEHNKKEKPFVWKKRDVKGSQLRNTIVNLIN